MDPFQIFRDLATKDMSQAWDAAGQRFRRVLLDRALTIRNLSAATGISEITLTFMAQGHGTIRDPWVALARSLRVSVEWLEIGESAPVASTPTAQTPSTPPGTPDTLGPIPSDPPVVSEERAQVRLRCHRPRMDPISLAIQEDRHVRILQLDAMTFHRAEVFADQAGINHGRWRAVVEQGRKWVKARLNENEIMEMDRVCCTGTWLLNGQGYLPDALKINAIIDDGGLVPRVRKRLMRKSEMVNQGA